MNIYQHRYSNLIKHYQSIVIEGYLEKHHIIPLCMGGTDDKSNLVLLSPRAHFLAHALLHKAYPSNRRLAHAFAMMAVNNPHSDRKFSSRMYALSKSARSMAMTGVPMPEWVKAKLRKPKSSKANYSKPKSSEHAANIAKALSGKTKSKEHIENMRKTREAYNQKRSIELQQRDDHFRTLFHTSNLSRKEFAAKYDLSYSYVKRCFKGL